MTTRTIYDKSKKYKGWLNINTQYAYMLLKSDTSFLEEVTRLKAVNALNFDTFIKIATDYNHSENESDNVYDIDWLNLYVFFLRH
jgi:hypothetical protein